MRWVRTWLFVPGHEPHKLRKALTAGADVIIADWEDAVPASEKHEARRITREILEAKPPKNPPRVVVRVNSPKLDAYLEDREVLEGLSISGVLVPKVESSDEVRKAAELGLPLIPMIESAAGLERALEIAQASPLVERLVFGSLDFLTDIRGRWTPGGEAIIYARSRIVSTSRAAGVKGPIDGVYPHLGDLDGLQKEARLARVLGFAGKTLIHPKQIEVVRREFAPTPEEVREAKEILGAYRKAIALGRSALQLKNGRFVDPPVVAWAEQILEEIGDGDLEVGGDQR